MGVEELKIHLEREGRKIVGSVDEWERGEHPLSGGRRPFFKSYIALARDKRTGKLEWHGSGKQTKGELNGTQKIGGKQERSGLTMRPCACELGGRV